MERISDFQNVYFRGVPPVASLLDSRLSVNLNDDGLSRHPLEMREVLGEEQDESEWHWGRTTTSNWLKEADLTTDIGWNQASGSSALVVWPAHFLEASSKDFHNWEGWSWSWNVCNGGGAFVPTMHNFFLCRPHCCPSSFHLKSFTIVKVSRFNYRQQEPLSFSFHWTHKKHNNWNNEHVHRHKFL